MYCETCGSQLEDDAAFCETCGSPTASYVEEPDEEPASCEKADEAPITDDEGGETGASGDDTDEAGAPGAEANVAGAPEGDVDETPQSGDLQDETTTVQTMPSFFCEMCGSPLEAGTAFCETCGSAVDGTIEADEQPDDHTAKVMPAAAFCEACESPLEAGVIFCETCGSAVGDSAVGEDVVFDEWPDDYEIEAMPAVAFCEACGSPLEAGAVFCEACGSAVGGSAAAATPVPNVEEFRNTQRKRGKRIGIIAGVAIVALILVGVGMTMGNSDGENPDGASTDAGDALFGDLLAGETDANAGGAILGGLLGGGPGAGANALPFDLGQLAGDTNAGMPDFLSMLNPGGANPAPPQDNEQATASNESTPLADAKVGQQVQLGSYPKAENGAPEPITWTVIGESEGQLLLISQQILDCKPMTESGSAEVPYAQSSLRAWLNGAFLQSAFTEEERSRIDLVAHLNEGKYEYDHLFVPSEAEVRQILTPEQAQATATDFAIGEGVQCDDNRRGKWWACTLPSSKDGESADTSAGQYPVVLSSGTISQDRYKGTTQGIGVRPFIWVAKNGSYCYVMRSEDGTSFSTSAFEDPEPEEDTLQLENRGTGNSHTSTSTPGYSGTRSVSVEASNGAILRDTVRVYYDGYVIPDSSTHEYTIAELRALNLSDGELCIAWNEPFARAGYQFKNSGLYSYFMGSSWYYPGRGDGAPTAIGSKNITLLQQIASERPSAAQWLSLAAY